MKNEVIKVKLIQKLIKPNLIKSKNKNGLFNNQKIINDINNNKLKKSKSFKSNLPSKNISKKNLTENKTNKIITDIDSNKNKNINNINNGNNLVPNNKKKRINKSLDFTKLRKIKSDDVKYINKMKNIKINTNKPMNTINNINIKNRKEFEMKSKEVKDNVSNLFVKNKLEQNKNSMKYKRSNTANKYIKKNTKINNKNDFEYLPKQYNNFAQLNKEMKKELDSINNNNIIINQNELKMKEIINNLERGNQLEKKLFEECINNIKEKIKSNYISKNIIINNEKINKLKELKNNIENNFKISNSIYNLINNDIHHDILKSNDKIQKYFQLSKEIQNSQKSIINNLIYEISYFKISIMYLIKNFNLKLSQFSEETKNNYNFLILKSENKSKEIEYNNEDYLDNYNKLRENLLSNIDKENLKAIVLLSPKKNESELSDLINYLKNETQNLNMLEKAYVVFYWMAENIIYDKTEMKDNKNKDSTPEGIYKYGKTICFGYSKLFAYIAKSIGIETEYIKGYAKGSEYNPGEQIEKTNHEWNAVKINDNYFLIDPTWGAGLLEENIHIKELDDFYFLPNPKHLIYTHFPEEPKWQLLKNPITKEEFINQIYINSKFFTFHFTDINFKKSHFEVNNIENIKIFYDIKNTNDIINLTIEVYFLKDNEYISEENCYYITKNEKYYEVKLIFNKMGSYKVCLYGKNQYMDDYDSMIEYYPTCKQDAPKDLFFPIFYSDSSEIEVINPLYNNLKSGDEVKFIIKSNNLDEIIIIGDKFYYVKKDNKGNFERTIKIGNRCAIGKKNSKNQCEYLVKYDIKN